MKGGDGTDGEVEGGVAGGTIAEAKLCGTDFLRTSRSSDITIISFDPLPPAVTSVM